MTVSAARRARLASSRRRRDGSKLLPAYGRDLLELRRRGLVPANARGVAESVYCVIDDWKICSHRHFRCVVPQDVDPETLDWCFIAALVVFVIWSMARTSQKRRDAVLRGIARARPRFLFVVDWDAPEHGFMVISRRDGVLRPDYSR